MKTKALLRFAKSFLTLLFLALMSLSTNVNAATYYVRPFGNSTAWANVSGVPITTLASGNAITAFSTINASATGADTYYFAPGTYNINFTFALTTGKVYGGFSGSETSTADLTTRATSDLDANGIIEAWEFTNVVTLTASLNNGSYSLGGTARTTRLMTISGTGGEANGITLYDFYCKTTTAQDGVIVLGDLTLTNTAASYAGKLTQCIVRQIKNFASTSLANNGIIMLTNASSNVDKCLIEDSRLPNGSGTVYMNKNGGTVSNSVIRNNYVVNNGNGGGYGGGIYLGNTPATTVDAIVSNCAVYNNTGTAGGAIRGQANSATSKGLQIVNCTVVNNSTGSATGAASIELISSGLVANTICISDLWSEIRLHSTTNYVVNSVYGALATGGQAIYPAAASNNNTASIADNTFTALNFKRATTFQGYTGNNIDKAAGWSTAKMAEIKAANYQITSTSSHAYTTANATLPPSFGASGGGGTAIAITATVPSTDINGETRNTIGAYNFKPVFDAVQTGDWTSTSTWSSGVVPGASDDVTITGYTVTVPSGSALAQSITVQSDATTAGKLIIQSGASLTASTGGTPLVLKGGEVENAGTLSLTTTATGIATCFQYSNTNASMLVTNGKYSGAGALSLNSSTATSGAAITMTQSQTIGDPVTDYIGGIFTVGGSYTFNIAANRPIFNVAGGRPLIDGTGTITAGTIETPVSHGLIMITGDYGNLTVNPSVTLSIVSNMAVANRGPIYFHNMANETLNNKGTINITGAGTPTNAIGSIAPTTGTSVLTNEGTITVAGAFSESAISINGGLNANFNITNTGALNISGLSSSIPALAALSATNSNLTFTNNTNGVLDINAGNTGIVSGGLGAARVRLINSGGTLKGSGILNGAFESSTGTVSPGGAGIGMITISQLQASAANTDNLSGNCLMHYNGKTTPGTDFDQIAFLQATVNVNGATVEAIKGNGYAAVLADVIPIFSFVAHSGAFSTTTVHANTSIDYGVGNQISLSIGSVGVELNAMNAIKLYGSNGKIAIDNASNKALNIYSLEGKKVYSTMLKSNNEVLTLQKGIYVVNIDNKRSKVIVR